MSTECASTSVRSATPRFQQPRRTLSPPENAAAGDALCSQVSSELNLNLGSSAEIMAIDTSRQSVSELWRFLNDPTDQVLSETDKDNSWNNGALGSRLLDFNDEESRSTSNRLVERSKKGDVNDLENQKPFEKCSVNDRADVDEILFPDRKISMFSAEIWTEKVLPNDSFIYPEPELVELYFDKNTRPDGFYRFGGYSTESIEVPTMWRGSNRGSLGSTTPVSPPLSAKKSKTSSSGQKTINFDDEIWPVCPLLIPSERKLSQSVLRNKYGSISPERLIANNDEAATVNHLESKSLSMKDESTLDATSRSHSRRYGVKNNSKGSKVVEPTHEIEHQDASIDSPEKLQKSYNETNLVINTPRRLQKDNLKDEDLKSGSLAEVADRKFKARSTGKEIKKFIIDYEQYQTRHSKDNLLSLSNSEPVNRISDDIPSKKQEVSSAICNEILSADKIESKEQTKEHSKSRFDACLAVKQDSFTQIEKSEINCDVYEEQTISRNANETPQSSIMNSNVVISASENKFNRSEECVINPSDLSPDFELRAMEVKDLETSVAGRKIKKNRKGVKVVRFQTCEKSGDIGIDETVPKDAENFESNYPQKDGSRTEFVLGDRNETPDFLSVESFQQEVNQVHLGNKSSRQIEIDPALDDALETLAKVERIVESNRQTEERLQQVQPNAAILWVTPPDAGKLLAKALMRCRNYMLNNGYNRGATITINKLLTSKVQNLKQLIERQRQTLIAQEKHRSAPCGRRQSTRSQYDNFPNSKGPSISNEIGTYQIKLLIADILTSTEKLAPKLTATQAQKKASVNTSKISTKNNRTLSDTVHSHHEELTNKIEDLHPLVPPATPTKKPASSELVKTSKKIFNDLFENRPKTLSRHYNVNDSMNNFRSSPGPHNNSVSQKLPVWKPGGSNFVQSSVNITPNNQKIRSLPSSTTKRRRNSTNEQTKDTKSQQRNKVKPTTVKDGLKITEKSIVKAHDTTPFVKVRKEQIKGHRSEMDSLEGKKVQLLNEVVETRARKPRSKSRTRTRSPIKMPRITVTEIPLEHATEYSPMVDQKAAVAKELPVSKKASSYPKGIIRMLEELIRSSSHETSIRNASSAQIVARCNAAVKEDISNFVPLKSKVGTVIETESDSFIALSKSKSNQLKLTKKVTVPETTAEVIDDVIDPRNIREEFDLSSTANAAGVLRTPKPKSEINGNKEIEELNRLSASDMECTVELNSEHSIGCVSSKYCQASLTSVTSQEISEEIICNQISDTAVSSSHCEETPKESDESFDTVEDEEVTRDEYVLRFQRDQSVSTENELTPKRKFFNRHARSLEMLKEILSDQGLGIHFLSRAENEVKDRRCKCSSSRKGFTTRKTLSGEIFGRTLLPERNLSSALLGKLATLSESESDIEQVEVATMTLANDSIGGINQRRTSDESEFLNGIVTVENATQFDIPLKLDAFVGDELVSNTFLPLNTKSEHILADIPEPMYASPDISYPLSLNREKQEVDENENFECKLPNHILEAFKLADIRARNLYIAFCILKEGLPSGIIQDAGENLIMPGHDQGLDEKSSQRSNNLKSYSPLKIITPRIRKNMENRRSELDTEKSQARSIVRNNASGIRNFGDEMTDDKSQKFSSLDKNNLVESSGQPKPIKILRKSSVVKIDDKIVLQKQNVDPNGTTCSNNEPLQCTVTPRSIAALQSKDDQLLSHYQKSLIIKSGDEKLIKTLHFAGRQQSSSVIENTSRIIEITMNPGSLSANSLDHESRKTVTKIRESLPGSRIQTLLKENLQRFRIDHSPIDDELIFEDFRDQPLAESTDDEVVINEAFIETATSSSRTHLADCNIHSEVENLLNGLLNEVIENWESSVVTDHRDRRTDSPTYRRVGKSIRKSKSDRGRKIIKYGNRSLFCGKCFGFFSDLIVSREHLLSLIYAAVCSFVFCCLQFSVHCEV